MYFTRFISLKLRITKHFAKHLECQRTIRRQKREEGEQSVKTEKTGRYICPQRRQCQSPHCQQSQYICRTMANPKIFRFALCHGYFIRQTGNEPKIHKREKKTKEKTRTNPNTGDAHINMRREIIGKVVNVEIS